MTTKIRFFVSLFFLFFIFFTLITVTSSSFAEVTDKVNKIDTPQGTAETNIDQQGTSGVDAGATDKNEKNGKNEKTVASANIINSKVKTSTTINDNTKVTTQNSTNETGKNEANEGSLENSKSIKKEKDTKKPTEEDPLGTKEIPFADNEQIRVILSNRDINRVSVVGDKIKTIHGPTGLYTAKNDSSDPFGSAYISISSDSSFTIFLATIKGHVFSLLVIPRMVPGKTIVLEPTTPTLLSNSSAETDSYQKSLIDLISNMINLEPCENYEYFSISEAKKHKWIKNIKKVDFYNVADVIPVAFYRGEKLSGVISRIRNKTKSSLTLKPSYFYQSGVKAVALSGQVVPSLGACWLYQIVGQD